MAVAKPDDLQIYLGFEYPVTDKITIHQPTVEEVAKFGERRYYSTVFRLTCIPSDMKSQLEDLGFNYMKVPDYELFLFLSKSLKQEDTSLLLGDLDLSKMEIVKDSNTGETVLADYKTGAKIDRYVYLNMVEFLRKVHGIVPKVENAANETTRQILIKLERQKLAKAEKENKSSQLKPIISGLLRSHTATIDEAKKMTIHQLTDAIRGAQVFVATNALMIGSYSGMVDTKKINKKEFDWMRDISESNSSKITLNEKKQTAK